ncbi:MAG: hypothetical protein IIX45_01655 [Lachnospiraceae bacterium]|nr:hypothetical protein [Lachnospiraceae bacterium]
MVNVNVRRLTIAGQVARVMEAYENEIYTYKIAIRKADGRIWVVNISEDLYFKTLKHDDFVFELAMVFENDDMNGMVNTELSKVEAVYARGKDISDEDFVAQQELDKSWPMVTDNNIESMQGENKKSRLKFQWWILLVAVALIFFFIGLCREGILR